MESKQDWINILTQATEIADQAFKHLKLPAGSYTAEDVHKTLTRMKGRYTQKKPEFVYTQTTGDDKYNPMYNYCHILKSGGQTVSVLTPHIFYAMMNYEKLAGVKPKERHIWIKESKETLVGTITVTFPSSDTVKTLPSYINGMVKRNSDCMVFVPIQGRLLAVNDIYICYNSECKIEGDLKLPEVAFRFNTSTFKHIYGVCAVDYYVDKKGRYSLVITNEQGWKTSLCNYLSEYEMRSILNESKRLESKTYNNTIAPLLERYNHDHEIMPSKPKAGARDNDMDRSKATAKNDSNEATPVEPVTSNKVDGVKDDVASVNGTYNDPATDEQETRSNDDAMEVCEAGVNEVYNEAMSKQPESVIETDMSGDGKIGIGGGCNRATPEEPENGSYGDVIERSEATAQGIDDVTDEPTSGGLKPEYNTAILESSEVGINGMCKEVAPEESETGINRDVGESCVPTVEGLNRGSDEAIPEEQDLKAKQSESSPDTEIKDRLQAIMYECDSTPSIVHTESYGMPDVKEGLEAVMNECDSIPASKESKLKIEVDIKDCAEYIMS